MKDKQGTLGLDTSQQVVENVDKYQFEPIKGYPMLNWRGKRPFTSTQFYPAQLKEVHGEEVDGWRNKVYWGDNLQVMSHLLKEFRGKVDLIYIDPPFDSKADYKKNIQVKGKGAENDSGVFEEKQYTDIWTNDEYLQFMYERLLLCRELLSETGTIFIHCDWHKSHHIKCIMDEVFGTSNFQNNIVWNYSGWNKKNKTYFNRRYDNILFFSKTEKSFFNPYKEAWKSKEDYVTQRKQKVLFDDDGREYVLSDAGKGQRVKRYLDEALLDGKHIDDVWFIDKLNNSDKERLEYPTQKPEKLLERIIISATPKEGLVFDCFMGSGTTQAVAMKLGRRFIGADINLGAVQTTTKRLIKVADELRGKLPYGETTYYTGFEVYNVNHYDIFRNPVQAKELLIEALEIQPLAAGALFDGEKDGRMVKIMPVNRIATRADLNELVTGFNYKAWEERQNQNPNQPVEKILLVCMGHEADLKAQLELAAKPFKIDVEVVDILRDKSNLEFKRDSDARLALKAGTLVIERFYPMNLLQKLSLQKENVEDWRELVESILIDWNYDGSVLQPTLLDIPGKDALVQGSYPIPADASTIRVKITDLLSESWEGEIQHG